MDEASLAMVGELAISETDLSTVQDFIADQYRNLEPAGFHSLLPTFRWRGLVTTNYDLLTERIYETARNPLQKLVPFISDRDRIDEKLRSSEHLGLLKLHGCITQTHDPALPLILTPDQYVTHRQGRKRLFTTFQDWGVENPVVFVGSALQDLNLRAILVELSEELSNRPRYYMVAPNTTQAEKNFWGEKRITVLDGQFEDFLRTLDVAIPRATRPLAQAVEDDHPIRRKFIVNEPLDGTVKDLLDQDVQYVHPELRYEEGTPQRFYKGFDLGWYPVVTGLDVRRHRTDEVLFDVITRAEEDRPTLCELYVIKAEAGAGKTTFLRRVAWEAATQSEALCLFARPSGTPRFESIRELHRVTNERVFLFVDQAADNILLISSLIEGARRFKVPLTVITAERINEWNMSCDSISGYVSDEYQLQYLNHAEIEKLVTLLRNSDALGPNLRGRSFAAQVEEFEERAGRQLLVALHEATMGRRFEDILLDEYNNIHPQRAQSLYLTVCLLNRLGVPVRAGLVSRVHGIPFTDFEEELFAPLEHVVEVRIHRATRDYMYVTRHPEIAQIVFEKVLTETADRYDEYVRVLKHMNISYSSDRTAFRKLIRAKALDELFSNYEDVMAIFGVAEESAGKDAYVYQQMANYERRRPNGNYSRAHELLQKARDLEPRNTTLIHSLAELARTRALDTNRPLERLKFRNEARSLLGPLLQARQPDPYVRHTAVKLGLDELEDLLSDENSTDEDIDDTIRKVENLLDKGQQQFPEDSHLRMAEADFRRLLRDHSRSLRALKSAFESNPRDPYIATRLARTYESEGDLKSAAACLRRALDANRGDKQLNFQYAEVRRKIDPSDINNLIYHYRRAFTDGDRNYNAQFWYARYLFEDSDPQKRKDAKMIFQQLRDIPMDNKARHRPRDYISVDSSPKRFTGSVNRINIGYGFATIDNRGEDIFFHQDSIDEATWSKLKFGSRIRFRIGFTFSGPQAFAIEVI